jgi:hypothetical protein
MPPDLAGSSQMICCCLLDTHAWGQLAEKAIACTVMSQIPLTASFYKRGLSFESNLCQLNCVRLFTTYEAVPVLTGAQ